MKWEKEAENGEGEGRRSVRDWTGAWRLTTDWVGMPRMRFGGGRWNVIFLADDT